MKKKLLKCTPILFLFQIIVSSFVGKDQSEMNLPGDINSKVTELIAKMSLEEKAGQMTQIDIRNLLEGGYGNKNQKLDSQKLKEAIQTYHVGSILNCIEAYSSEKWIELISQIQKECLRSRIKIPVIYGTDAVHGVGFIKDAVLFPHNIGLAATRNNMLVKKAAQATAEEARAVGFTWNFAPVLDVGRQPYWSRLEETFGEDVYITSKMGTEAILGMEGQDLNGVKTIASCMKHFIGYSAPKNGIDRTPAHIPDIVLREYYLPPFEAAVKANAATVMINSAEINGIPTHANKKLLTDLLRNELGYEGLACSDWEDIIRLHTWQKIAATPKEAVALAVNAGIDMSMVPNDYSFPKYVVELVKENKIPMKRIDEAVRRILTLKFRLGLFDHPLPELKNVKNIKKEEHLKVSLQAARESITLLENKNNVLPISKDKKVLIAGPCADNITTLNSAWSYTWQGNDESLYPSGAITIKEALEQKMGKKNVISNATKKFTDPENYDLSFLKSNASNADIIILCIGEQAYAEQPGVIKDLNLPAEQKELIRAAHATGKPVVVCLVEGRPRLFPEEAALCNAVIMCYRPGNAGGQAIAEVLTGEINPSGLLPFTYPKYNGDIVLYDHKYKETEQQLVAGISDTLAFQPQWPFGHGLSYTEFEFSNLKTDKSTFSGKDIIKVSIDVRNVGKRAGMVAVELYSRDHFASITPSQRRLRRYEKVELQSSETKSIQFIIQASDLQFVNEELKWVTEPGSFDLMVKDQKVVIEYKN